MRTDFELAELERKRTDLLRKAAAIVRAAAAASRELTSEEDSQVLDLSNHAHLIEEVLVRSKRHHEHGEA
jgi:hypothetical protein